MPWPVIRDVYRRTGLLVQKIPEEDAPAAYVRSPTIVWNLVSHLAPFGSSNVGQPVHHVGKSLHHANQQSGLSIRLRSPLFPILESPHVGAQVSGEETT
jgi:hypothetical protein